MPRNNYGPEDPETSIRVEGGKLVDEEGPLLAYSEPAPLKARCSCGAPAVTMSINEAEVGRLPDGKVPLVARCAACARTEGERAKRDVLQRHSERRKKSLDWLHAEMLDLYHRRLDHDPATAFVTVVDARRAYRRMPEADANADLRFMGSLFRSRGWEKIEGKSVKNSDEGNHARPVDCWRYVKLGVKSP